MGKGRRRLTTLTPPRLHQPGSWVHSGLSGFYGGFITWAQLLSPPRRPRGRTESSNLLITWLVLPVTRPHPQVQSKSHLINKQKNPFSSYRLGTCEGFEAVSQEPRVKIKYIFITVNHNITAWQAAHRMAPEIPASWHSDSP